MHPETPAPRTGPLRNGNPCGNPNLAPRCSAKARTTGCPCQAPAMPNGRCRMHGGLATGPRTPEGRARVAAANTRHGFYTAETQANLRRSDRSGNTSPPAPAKGTCPETPGHPTARHHPRHREDSRAMILARRATQQPQAAPPGKGRSAPS